MNMLLIRIYINSMLHIFCCRQIFINEHCFLDNRLSTNRLRIWSFESKHGVTKIGKSFSCGKDLYWTGESFGYKW